MWRCLHPFTRRFARTRPLLCRAIAAGAITVVLTVLLSAASAVLGAGPGGVVAAGDDRRCYDPPVVAPIVDRFRQPSCPYCSGRRGIAFASRPGDQVRAVASGVVTFDGSVAGTRYLVVAHDDGLLATYGRVARSWLHVGQRVRSGQVVAVAGEERLYFGLRDGDQYVDPEPLLGVRGYPVRLVPSDRRARRWPGPGRLVCPVGRRSR